MTTTITESEIKLIYIEIVLVAIIGVFLLLFASQPVPETSMTTQANAQNQSVSGSDASWLSGLATPTMGFPVGTAELLIISSIVLIPLTIMNAFVAIRFIKDIATGWI